MKPSLVLSANAPPLVGGQGLNLFHMMEALRSGFDLRVFCDAPSGGDIRSVRASRLARTMGRLPVIRRFRDWQIFLDDSHFDRQVAAALPASAVFQGVTGQCWQSLARARELGARTVLDVVTTHADDFLAHQRRECARFDVPPAFHPRMHRRILDEYRRADLIRVMSRYALQTFLDRGFSPRHVIKAAPPIDVAQFPEANFSQPCFRIIFVGLLEPWKGFHYLVEAFEALNLAGAELVLWGGPGARGISRYLREKMSRNRRIVIQPTSVRAVGYAQVYGAASVLVQPSLADGFGYAVGEAMASGLPVIVTRATGAEEMVTDGENGYVVPPGDRDAIADRLRHLAARPALVREMGRKARAAARRQTRDQFRRALVTPIREMIA